MSGSSTGRDARSLVGLPALAALLLLTAVLAVGCAKPTPYQARGPDGMGPRYGYDEQKLAEDRYRVTVSGNEVTSRDTVENYLLFRAAELTLHEGYEAFRIVERDTDPVTRYATTYMAGPRRPLGYAFLPGPLHNPGYLGGPPEAYRRPVTRYRAQAEIQLLDRMPRERPAEVYEARALLTQLAPAINRPKSLAN